MDKTRAGRPGLPRTITQTVSTVDVDDLPCPAPAPPRAPDLGELADVLRYQLHAVEAQVVALGRELMASAQGVPPEPERALHLVTSSISAARAALRLIDRLGAPSGRPRTPIPPR